MAEDIKKNMKKFKIGDIEFDVPEEAYEQLEKGVLMQSDYTKKTQELAKKEKEYQERLHAYEEKMKDLGSEIEEWNKWYVQTGQFGGNTPTYRGGDEFTPSGDGIDENTKNYIHQVVADAKATVVDNLKGFSQK